MFSTAATQMIDAAISGSTTAGGACTSPRTASDKVMLRASRYAIPSTRTTTAIRGPLRDAPLAVCDATSVAFSDFVPSDLVYRDRTGETYRVTYNPAHRWFYVPEMRADEAVLIKCYDSAEDGTARFTAHSAFEDPTAPANVLPRESIEVRTLVFHNA